MSTDPNLLEGTTPGPWHADQEEVLNEHGHIVARSEAKAQFERVVANARLIAAAPDLASEVATLRAENERLRESERLVRLALGRCHKRLAVWEKALTDAGLPAYANPEHLLASVSSEGSG